MCNICIYNESVYVLHWVCTHNEIYVYDEISLYVYIYKMKRIYIYVCVFYHFLCSVRMLEVVHLGATKT